MSKIRPEEENDEARLNEARTASFLLLKLARENGVQVKFIVNRETPKSKPASQSTETPDWNARYPFDPFQRPEPVAPDMDEFFDVIFGPDFRRKYNASDADFRDVVKNAKDAQRQAEAAREARHRSRDQEPPFKSPQRSPNPSSKHGDVPLINAKFAGRCKKCHRSYAAGDHVWWVKGLGCTHEACGFDVLLDGVETG